MTSVRFGFLVIASLMLTPGATSAAVGPSAAVPGEQARQLLEMAGVHGGLVVHLGCGDGRLTAALRMGDGYLVHGLDADAKNVETARGTIQSLGLYGPVSADAFDGQHLPYVDGSVNLVLAERLDRVPESEVLRVLAPGGVACVNRNGEWTRTVKPWPTEIDEWSHYLHGPDNNAVARDSVVGPPRRLQWQGGPKWTRQHDHMSSVSAVVSSRGRLFYILDEGSTASLYLPSHWALIARDAFNGKILWKRPIPTWFTRFKGLKDGPADAPRRLVASGDRVYATLSLDGPVTALDAVTGQTIRTYTGTQRAEEILLADGVLFVVIGPGSLGDGGRLVRPIEKRTIAAIEAESGKRLWEASDVVAAMTLAVDAQRACYFNCEDKTVIALDRKTGRRLWRSETLPAPEKQFSFFASKLVLQDGVVLFASGEFSGVTKSGGGETRADTLTALSAETGNILWQAKHPPSGYSSPENLFVIDGLVWCDSSSNGKLDGTVIGLDLKTGAEKYSFPADEKNYWFHHRCYSGRATTNYLMTSRTGIEFIDFRRKHWDLNHWTRGACLYGIMPANGLVYTPPSPCICYAETMMHSFNAFAPAAKAGQLPDPLPAEKRLEKGPAHGQPVEGTAAEDDWPTYRGDNARSGSTRSAVPAALQPAWKADLGGRLTSLVVAGGRVFLAAVDRHTVYALDASSGKTLWQYTAGARVDSPPTWFEGLVLFGCADGRVYCLRASDGALVWRFLAAPVDRRIVSYEQLESLWPVHGSILVRSGIAHFVAGRSIFLDGGMRLVRLDARTGAVVSETALDERNPATGKNIQELVKWLNMPVGCPDILSCDGQRIYMRSQAFDFEGRRLAMGPITDGPQEGTHQGGEGTHLFCPTGFLDDTWFHRTYWLFGKTWGSGWNGYYINGKFAPGGRILSVGGELVFGFDRQPQYYRWTTPMEYRLYAARKEWKPQAPIVQVAARKGGKKQGGNQPAPVDNKSNYAWTTQLPILVRAMALCGGTLFVAGPKDVLDESHMDKNSLDESLIRKQEAALEGKDGAVLRAVSAKDGETLAEYLLDAPPVFDGMAAAGGRLYLATTGGKLVCFAGASDKSR
jgi:outer membrane protein assembly factor BamB